MRVAVCISGQMRTFSQTIENLKKHLLDKYDCDIFLHTWEEKGITTDVNRLFPKGMNYYFSDEVETNSSLFMKKYKLIFDDIIDENILSSSDLSVYPNLKSFKIEKTPSDYEKEKKLFSIQYPKYLQDMFPRRFHNLALFYKIYKCNELKENYEKENGFLYDAVIKIRPDVNLLSDIIIPENIEDSFIYVKGEMRNENYIHDQTFFSSSKTMDKIASLWLKLDTYWNPEYEKEWEYKYRTIGDLLYYHVNNIGINRISISYKSSLSNFQDKKTPTFDFFQNRLDLYLNTTNHIERVFLNSINSAISENALNFYDTNKEKCFALLNKQYVIGNYLFSHPPYGLGYFYIKEKQYESAISNLKIAYQIEFDSYKIFKLYVEALFLNGSYKELKDVLDDTVNRSFYSISIDFIITYYRKIESLESIIELFSSREISFFNHKSLYKIGIILFNKATLEKAIFVFLYIKSQTNNQNLTLDCSYKIAQAYKKLNKIQKSYQYIEEVLAVRSTNDAYILFKVMLLKSEKRYGNALELLISNRVNFEMNSLDKYYYELANIYLMLDKHSKALVCLTHLDENYKNSQLLIQEIYKVILID